MDGMSSESKDVFMFDMERLESLASSRIVERGVKYFNENRVTELRYDDERVSALVEGSLPDDPYFVEITRDGEHGVVTSCSCAFDWEPTCKHAVAVLLAYQKEVGLTQADLKDAADAALADRMLRGRTEVRVTHLKGKPWFGTWRAGSVNSHTARTYEVQIRSLERKGNVCTCPDFAINLLGTCKHIEAVLHRLKKRAIPKISEPPVSFVYLSWEGQEAPQMRVQRSKRTGERATHTLNRFFDAEGVFQGALPEDFFRMSDELEGQDGVLIGADAMGHARWIMETRLHEAQAGEIRKRISACGGQIPGVFTRLYPYQVEGVAFLVSNGRALLADDMGLGKTIQSIAAASWLMSHQHVERTFIVCPASLKTQWAREIQRFTGKSTQIVGGHARERLQQYKRHAAFTIANYELVLRDVTEIHRCLAPDLMILDEAQRVKNWRTKSAGAIRRLETRYLFVLTGTPLENRLEDLFSILQLVDGRVLGPLWRFFIEFHVTNERGRIIGHRNLSELRRRIRDVRLRRSRSIVSDQLPERIQHRFDVPMTARQRDLHDNALASASQFAQIAKRRPLTPSESQRMMGALQTARMAATAAFLVDEETPDSPKLEELSRLLEELCEDPDTKVVVFSTWERMTYHVEQMARKLNLGVVRLHGRIPTHKRGGLLDQFREDPQTQLFVSTDAGGVGLNLQSASVVINLDPPWNPAVLQQRIARVHRLGQKKTVQVINMFSQGSYEERIFELLQSKQELFDNVVDPEAIEDVVGVTKKTLDALIEDLDEQAPSPGDAAPAMGLQEPLDEPDEGEKKTEKQEEKPTLPADSDLQIRVAVSMLQETVGGRLERVLGSKGGLIAVLKYVDEALDAAVADIDTPVAIALIDTRTYNQLKKLGKHSPIAAAEEIISPEPEKGSDNASRMAQLAQRKLRSAQVLLEQELVHDGVALLAEALASHMADKLAWDEPRRLNDVAVWAFSEGLSTGVISQEHAMLLGKTLSLTQADTLLPPLAAQLQQEISAFIQTP